MTAITAKYGYWRKDYLGPHLAGSGSARSDEGANVRTQIASAALPVEVVACVMRYIDLFSPKQPVQRFANNVSVLVAFAVALTTGVLGCGGSPTLSSAVATDLVPSAADISFGEVALGQYSDSMISVTNSSSGPLEIAQVTTSDNEFVVSGPQTLPMSLPAGGSMNLSVQFNPSTLGSADGSVTVLAKTGSSAQIRLHGTGAAPVFALTCASTTMAGAGSDSCTVTLASAAPRTGQAVSLTDNSNAVTIPASVTVASGTRTASFTAQVAAVTSPQQVIVKAAVQKSSASTTIQLNPSLGTLSVAPASLSFGSVLVGSSASQNLTLSSTGSAAVTVNSITAGGAGYSLSGATFPLTLNPGQTATLAVHFSPTSAGTQPGQLTVSGSSSAGSTSSVGLTGTGIAALGALTCSSSSLSGAGSDACTVSLNAAAPTGGQAVTLSSNSTSLTVPASVTIAGGGSSVGFTATAASITSNQSGVISATANGTTKSFAIQLSASSPALSLSATTLSFGNLAVGSSSTQSVTLNSTGSGPVTVNSAAVSGAGFAVSGASFPLTLNPGQNAALTVQYAPTTSGAATGQLTVSSNSSTGGTTAISLSGTGIPVISSLTCTNASLSGAGTDPCTISLNAAAPAGGLAILLNSNNTAVSVPASVTVAAGGTSASFSATATAVSSIQTVNITASANGSSKGFSIQLNAASGSLSLSSSSVAFGSINVGQTATKTVTLTASGNSAVTISSVSVSGGQFSASGISTPLTLNSGQTATLTLSFYAASSTSFTGSVTLANNSSQGAAAISLSGTGVPVLSGLTCNQPSISGAGTDSCLVNLNGTATGSGFVVGLSSDNSSISVPSSVTIPSGSMSASFAATATSVSTNQTANLTATAVGITKTYALQISAAVPTLTVNASSVPFGNVVVNSAASQSITLTSAGNSAVVISAISTTGAGFSTSGVTLPLTINAGQTATLSIQFKPTAAGNFTGQITITSNSSNGSLSLGVTGTGFVHQVELNWSEPASGSDPAVSYNVYRVVSGVLSYTKINALPVTSPTYTDGTVAAGSTYNYYVTSVDSAGKESVPSNITQVSVPTP